MMQKSGSAIALFMRCSLCNVYGALSSQLSNFELCSARVRRAYGGSQRRCQISASDYEGSVGQRSDGAGHAPGDPTRWLTKNSRGFSGEYGHDDEQGCKRGLLVKYSFIALALAAATLTPSAFAGFNIQDTQILGSDDAAMGKYQPYEAPANGTFRSADGSRQSNQERYKDAELMVDLAYIAISQRGSGPAPVFDGFGDDLPFTSAMTMILPQGWRFYRDKELDPKAVPEKVSYPGGRPWPEVMKQIGDRYALHFHLDWYDRTVMMTKGRFAVGMQTARVKVINEPTVAPVIATVASAGPLAAVATGVAPSKSFSKTSAPPVAVVAGSGSTNLAAPSPNSKLVSSAPVVAPVAVKPLAPPAPVPPPIPSWEVTTKDRTMREALKKWAGTAGWTFQPEHWAVPVDIPLTAGASFRGDFKTAVRQLIASTELSETPLQPCFYSNRVVRVVPINEMCDRMSAR